MEETTESALTTTLGADTARVCAAIVDEIAEFIAIFDGELRVVGVNRSLCDALGFQAEELLGMSAVDMIAPNSQERAAILLGIATKQGAMGGAAPYDLVCADGSVLTVEVTGVDVGIDGEEFIVVIGRSAYESTAIGLVLDRLLANQELGQILEPLLDLFAWRSSGSGVAITWSVDGTWHSVSTSLPDELTGMGRLDPAGPWARALALDEGIHGSVDALLPAEGLAVAKELGFGQLWVEPVTTVSVTPEAMITVLMLEGGYPPLIHRFGVDEARRYISVVLRWSDALRRLEHDARRDDLTGLANRRTFFDGLSAAAYVARAEEPFEVRIGNVFTEYQARLRQAGAMDFDDLLANTVELFRACPDVLEHYQRRFSHILVDEYQDTNHVQNELVCQLGAQHRNVFVVGDADQSIYNFRGADVRNILEFDRAFPDRDLLVLDQNYRSTQTILDAANAVIANNSSRVPKDLWTDQGPGHKIMRYHADDEGDEAQWIAHQISQMHQTEQLTWGDTAIFYRTNAQSRVIEEALFRGGVPYRVIGGTRFYDRKEVKDALAYVRTVINPADEVSVKRVLNVPKRGIGDTTVGKLDSWVRTRDFTFFQGLRRAEDAGVSGRALKGIAAFVALIDELGEVVDRGPAAVIELALERSGYAAELVAEHSVESDGRIENLGELVGLAREYDTVDAFLEQVSLVADTDQLPDTATDGDSTQVLLMTLHAAKGLEFPVVFLLGMEDGVFPHLRSLGDPEQLEEERRLAYVGITRARERLFLTNAWSRNLWGSTQYNPPSRFLDEIPESLISVVEGGRRADRGGSWGDYRPMSGGSPSSWGAESRSERPAARPEPGSGLITAPSPAGPSREGADDLGLRIGDDVRHPTFGEGVVIDISGNGDKAEVRVNFRDKGEKQLLLAWAPLEKIS